MIRHAVLQLKPQKGHIRANLEHVAGALDQLRKQTRAEGKPLPEVAVLPEAYLSGYFVQGGVRELAITQSELEERCMAMYHGLGWAEGLDLVIGFYEQDGGIYYNSVAYIELGGRGLLHVHRKVFLPTYGVFDDERYLSRGSRIEAFDTRFGRVAMLICEDFWHSITATIAALDGAEIFYVPSASPARGLAGAEPANVTRWKSLTQAVASEHGVYVVLASLVGLEGAKTLVGGSLIVGAEGNIAGQAPVFEEAILVGDIDLARIPPVRYDSPLLADLEGGLPLLMPDLERVIRENQTTHRSIRHQVREEPDKNRKLIADR